MGQHTEKYGDVTAVPAEVMASVGLFVAREWGGSYRMGFVGATHHEPSGEWVYVFQAKAGDGSRFAVGASRYGEPFELEGDLWLLWLQHKGIEASVRGCGSLHPVGGGVYVAR